jgi:hypothetical protein
MKSEAGPPHVILSLNLSRHIRVKPLWLLGRCPRQLRTSSTGMNTVYSRAEIVFILEHYFVLKSFAAIREPFNNAYPERELANKKTIH